MSMFSTMSEFVQKSFTTATKSLDSVEKTLDIANHFVDKNHTKLTLTITADARLATAKHHTALANELSADSNLKSQYEALEAAFA